MLNHDFDSTIVEHTLHRPWPIPAGPWLMTQTWHDLLFAHWRVATSQLRSLIPTAFELDLFNGQAWIGIVPFRMTNVSPRGVPSLPWISAFPEMNVRTYVRVGDRPGIYFLSLDAGSALAVWAAWGFLTLPYHTASMTVKASAEGVAYHSRRAGGSAGQFEATYGPTGPVFTAGEGSLEHFLTERYCLYNHGHRGRPYRLDIHHPPWPLQPAAASISRNTMADVNHVQLPDCSPLLHFAKRQDMVAWGPELLRDHSR